MSVARRGPRIGHRRALTSSPQLPLADGVDQDTTGTPAGRQRLGELMHRSEQGCWLLAAIAMALDGTGSLDQRAAAEQVAHSAGVDLSGALDGMTPAGVAAQAAAPILQVAALLAGDGQLWAGQSDEALLAQGNASALGAAGFVRFGLPMLPGLAAALARPGARMLDVGTGVAAMAVAYAQVLPAVTVVGIDVLPRVLALAARTVAASGVAGRVELREQDVSELNDDAVYALAWLPAPFLPEPALREGAARVVRALVPGGWVMLGHGKYGHDASDDAINRFKTIAFGGTALDEPAAQQLLKAAGIPHPFTVPTPPGSPAITVGQTPVRE